MRWWRRPILRARSIGAAPAWTALFPSGKGGGDLVKYGYKGKGVTIHSLVDANGKPLTFVTTPANVDERTQVEILLAQIHRHPNALYADKGYDALWLRWYLEQHLGIAPHISKRQWPKPQIPQPITQNHRWVVEQTFAWYQRKFRRINIKWERNQAPWKAFLAAAFVFFWLTVLVG